MALNATQAALVKKIESDIAALPGEAQAFITSHLPWVQKHYLLFIVATAIIFFALGKIT